MEAENSSTPTSRIESESESPPISQMEIAGSDLDSDKEGQGPGEGAGASTTTAVAASGSTGAEKKDISGCKTDGLRRPRLTTSQLEMEDALMSVCIRNMTGLNILCKKMQFIALHAVILEEPQL